MRLRQRRRFGTAEIGDRVSVYLHDGPTMRGVLRQVDTDTITLGPWEYLHEETATPLPGEANVLHANIDVVQRLTA